MLKRRRVYAPCNSGGDLYLLQMTTSLSMPWSALDHRSTHPPCHPKVRTECPDLLRSARGHLCSLQHKREAMRDTREPASRNLFKAPLPPREASPADRACPFSRACARAMPPTAAPPLSAKRRLRPEPLRSAVLLTRPRPGPARGDGGRPRGHAPRSISASSASSASSDGVAASRLLRISPPGPARAS